MSNTAVPTSLLNHRAEYVRKCIAEREQQAMEFRADALGADVSRAEWLLTNAKLNEAVAEGMRRALGMMLG